MRNISLPVLFFVCCISCNNNNVNKQQHIDDLPAYITMGDSIVSITFDTLRNTLLKKIGETGLPGALTFCNVQAIPITSIYSAEGITVSRVSDKNRNSANALSEWDKIEWEKYMELAAKKDSLIPVVISRNNEFHYYKPILMQPMCLSCHGEPGKEISSSLIRVIDSLYPSDKAKGYKQGDLRGMWHIVFNKNETR